MEFVKTHDISELNSELIGKQVVLGGWIFKKTRQNEF